TNLIENPNGAVRRVSGRVDRYRDVDMAMRWAATATGFLEAEKLLAVALHRPTDKRVDHDLKSA
ncbi:MAG: IS256 family transposase, partial [Burkholderia sp.]